MLEGRNLLLFVDNVAVAGAKSCELDVQSDVIETCSPSVSGWSEYIAGIKKWTVSCGLLIVDGDTIANGIDMVGRQVSLRFSVRNSQDYITGNAIVTTWHVTGTLPNLAQGSFSFRGTGPLT